MAYIIDKFQFKRGVEADIPLLDSGEPFTSEDTKKLFFGTPTGNVQTANQSDIDDLNTRIDTITSNHNGIDIKIKGCVGDGSADDTSAFNDANTEAISNNTFIRIPEGTYYINAATLASINVAPMIGAGIGKSILKVSGNVNFMLTQNNFFAQGFTVQVDYMVASTDSTGNALFLSYTNTLNSLIFKDIQYQNISGITDGSQRSVSLFRCHASNAYFQNLYLDGTHTGIVITKVAGTDCTNIRFKDIYFTNTITGIYCSGQNPNNAVTDVIKNISFENISLVNTATQAGQHAAAINGNDMIMLECCNAVRMSNLYAEYAIERLAYLNVCQDVQIVNSEAVNTEGIKFVGFTSQASTVKNYAVGCNITNLTLHTSPGFTRQIRAFISYCSKNILVNGVNAFDENTGIGTSGIDSVFELNYDVSNIVIQNVQASNILRSVLFLNLVYNADYYNNACFGITLRNVIGNNVNTNNAAYTAVRCYNDPAATGYIWNDVTIENMNLKQTIANDGTTVNTMYNSKSCLAGLYNLDRVKGFRARNNRVFGVSSNEPFTIGQNSYNVVVNEKQEWSLSMKFKGSYLSQGSVLEFVQTGDSSRTGMARNRVQINSVASDSQAVGLSEQNQQGQFEWAGTLANGQSVSLPYDASCLLGDGFVYDGAANYMHFLIQGTTLTKLDGTTATAVSNTAGDLCAYLNGGVLTILNNLGSTRRFVIKFTYST